MQDLGSAFGLAWHLVWRWDTALSDIVLLSLQVSLSAVSLACLVGLPLGAALAHLRFPTRSALIVVLNALMGLPPVVAGLAIYLLLSNAGPLGPLGLLYTPSAMIIAQAVLVMPIVAALSRQILEDLHAEYAEQFRSLGLGRISVLSTLLWEGRLALLTVGLAGFGRAIAEVGAVLIVGGNINHVSRVMTTSIALETSRGNLALALALGIVLIALTIVVNGCAAGLRATIARSRYA
jgi:tungstate transport system permease protein